MLSIIRLHKFCEEYFSIDVDGTANPLVALSLFKLLVGHSGSYNE